MNQATELDLEDLRDAMDHLFKMLPKLSLAARVDVAARLNPIVKTAKAIDEAVKDAVTEKCGAKIGEVQGEMFKAVLNVFPVERFQAKLFAEERPKIYSQYLQAKDEQRITFQVR